MTAGHPRGTPLVLCADDYGMNAGVGRAIRELAGAGRISATSCMANAASWPAEAGLLQPLRGRVGIGLHLTLSWGRSLGPMPSLAPDGVLPSIGAVIKASLSGQLPGPEIEAEVERQLARFGEWLGGPPDFVDGHQHVHVLPGIRGPLLAVLGRAGLAGGRLWLRDPADSPLALLARRREVAKAGLVGALATGFRQAAAAAGFRTNHGFSGFSPFEPAADYGQEMRAFLLRPGPRPLVMCHPGEAVPPSADAAEGDEIAAARPRELAFLRSEGFPALLARAGLRLEAFPA